MNSVKCGTTKIGNDPLTETAQGQFCIARLNVKNIGDSAQAFSADDQKAFIGGVKYSSAPDVGITYAMTQGEDWYKQINPGNSMSTGVVFDVPKGKVPDRLELHDSMLSDGAVVALK